MFFSFSGSNERACLPAGREDNSAEIGIGRKAKAADGPDCPQTARGRVFCI
ncbi:hypothetical protein [Ottowia massiliensis]|uniref:hypothetical protein n=1 Tax=Ottowia massiliensis TaxID=2045302 RepID=UPI00130456B2|nr:hypothetical protein [Ottowia massiliensis]